MEYSQYDCVNGIPSVNDFFGGLKNYQKWFFVIPSAFCLMTLLIYGRFCKKVVIFEPKNTKANVIILITVYPVSIV